MTKDELAAYNKELAKSEDHSKVNNATTPPGPCLMYFKGYIETGLQKSKNPSYKDSRVCILLFEVASVRHNKVIDGKVIHPVISARVNKSNSPKGNFVPLFKALNYLGTAKLITECLDMPYLGMITTRTVDDKTYVDIKQNGEPWDIKQPVKIDIDHPENSIPIEVPDSITDLMVFSWEPNIITNEDYLSRWDSLYIAGTYNDGNSRNKYQEMIMKNMEWEGSRLQGLIEDRTEGVEEIDDSMFE